MKRIFAMLLAALLLLLAGCGEEQKTEPPRVEPPAVQEAPPAEPAPVPEPPTEDLGTVASTLYGTITADHTFTAVVESGEERTILDITPANSRNVEFVGNYIPISFRWTAAGEDDWLAAEGPLVTLTSLDDTASIQCRGELVALTEGGETRYCRAQDPDDPDWSFFDHLMWIPKDAASALARSGTADGDLSMEEAAALLAEQWAEMYRTLPGWVEYRPADMQVSVTDIFDAFYGEPSQFCCDMSFVISVGYDPRQRGYWEAGAGLSDPIAEGEFAGYYHWGMQTLVAKNGDGNWYIADAGSGGYSVYLPGYSLSGGAENDLGNAPLRDLVDFYFQTAGFTHDYLLPYLISEKSPEELQDLNALLDQRTREEAKALVQNIAQVIQKCGWGDMVTLEELHDALDAKYQTYLD